MAEIDELMKFLDASMGLPVLMIAILLAAAGIDPGCLQMAVRLEADPNIFIGRRQAERGDPQAVTFVREKAAIRQFVTEALALAAAQDARFAVGHIDQAHIFPRDPA